MDERLRELEEEFWKPDADLRDLLERAFEYGLIEGEDHMKKDPFARKYEELGVNHNTIRNNAKEIVRLLSEDPNVDMMLVAWHYAEVRVRAVACGIPSKKLTAEFCEKVLEQVSRHHDAETGITWDVLDFWINKFKKDLMGWEDTDDRKTVVACTCDCGDSEGNCTGLCQAPDPQGSGEGSV